MTVPSEFLNRTHGEPAGYSKYTGLKGCNWFTFAIPTLAVVEDEEEMLVDEAGVSDSVIPSDVALVVVDSEMGALVVAEPSSEDDWLAVL